MFWAAVTAGLVYSGHAEWPFVSLWLGFAGACAVISVAALLARAQVLTGLRYLGEHSIVIYLSFFLPMAAARHVLIAAGLADAGVVALLVTIAGQVLRRAADVGLGAGGRC